MRNPDSFRWLVKLAICRFFEVHSDYLQRGAPIRVVLLDDRVEVESPGILLPGMTGEEMKQGTSRIRNPVKRPCIQGTQPDRAPEHQSTPDLTGSY